MHRQDDQHLFIGRVRTRWYLLRNHSWNLRIPKHVLLPQLTQLSDQAINHRIDPLASQMNTTIRVSTRCLTGLSPTPTAQTASLSPRIPYFFRAPSFVFASLKALPEFLQIRTATIPDVSSLNEAVSLYASLQAFAMSKAALRSPYVRTCMLQDSIHIHCRVESLATTESSSLLSTACLGRSNTTSDHHSLPSTILLYRGMQPS